MSIKIKAAAPALLMLAFAPGFAFAGGDSQTHSSTSYSEFDFARKDQNYYSTFITALNKDIDADGVLFRVESTYDKYKYANALSGAASNIDGKEWQGGAFIGYQIVRDGISYAAYSGLDIQSIKLTPIDATNPVRGHAVGAKIIGEIETQDEKPYYLDITGDYSTAFRTYFARARAGEKFGPGKPENQIAVGPEVSFIGDKSFDAQRVGGFILVPLNLQKDMKVEFIAAAGYQWVEGRVSSSDASQAGQQGAYATFSFSVAF